MTIELHPTFKRSYKKRVSYDSRLVKKTAERIKLFQQDSENPLLKDHKLIGTKHTGDIRIVYKRLKNSVLLYDIGTHNQVY